MGKAAIREHRFSRIVRANTRICGKTIRANKAFPNGEGYETRIPLSPKHSLSRVGKTKKRRLRRPKRKPTPPRCARQPLPREGACVDTPSFLWKEVPRRGGGWMEESGMKKSGGDRLKSTIYESTLSTADAVPLPRWGRLRYESIAFLALSERIHAYVEKQYGRTKPSPRGEGGERSEPDRVLAV